MGGLLHERTRGCDAVSRARLWLCDARRRDQLHHAADMRLGSLLTAGAICGVQRDRLRLEAFGCRCLHRVSIFAFFGDGARSEACGVATDPQCLSMRSTRIRIAGRRGSGSCNQSFAIVNNHRADNDPSDFCRSK